ncbi:hypothetical protein A9B99_13855 [Mangrovibacter phragmitis]|uniref:Uncharacterized protein n=1 Tax=Mangrovibacter phragmitis TaxID=1691903 RepID=A0A1B7KZG2_9ENTR|nr:hypothetical protein [Mangrovibacter phragmitis]OAT75403.1 hypothetical protein A9B99_13855 [Mangrovibacter phragmitis]
MENPTILLRRLSPFCARVMERSASPCQARAHAKILPVLSQQQLIHMAAKQKRHTLTPACNDKEETGLEFDNMDTAGEA